MIIQYIRKLVEGSGLQYEEARRAMKEIMSGRATPSQIAAFLTALRMKGETSDEIAALSTTMKELCHRIHPQVDGRLIDTCGTGGDQLKTFNISTTAAFVVAGAGVAVAKHGNRSFTSKSGSADMMEQFGFNLKIKPETVEKNINAVGIGFMFAPAFHPAMKHAVVPRRDIGVRTVFNILGPLSNPADADGQLVGVYSHTLVAPLAQALKKLGLEEAMVVHGVDGLDEISTIGKTVVAWLREGEVKTFEITPHELGFRRARATDVGGSSPQENAEVCFKIIAGKGEAKDPKKDIVLANAAAGIIVGGKARDFPEGVELARESINSGKAYRKLRKLIKASDGALSRLEQLESNYD